MLTATGPSPGAVLATAPPPSSSTCVSPSAPARATPGSTTAPVKSATNADAGVAATSPGARGYAAMTWVPGLDRVVVFGGKALRQGSDGEPMRDEIVNDLWAWDGKAWSKLG